ncbi:MAG: hypothetical protein OEW09_02315, partial [Anaerolineae bacterium]|nr:hypothetical protein [Anaerolineae bacterium]
SKSQGMGSAFKVLFQLLMIAPPESGYQPGILRSALKGWFQPCFFSVKPSTWALVYGPIIAQ